MKTCIQRGVTLVAALKARPAEHAGAEEDAEDRRRQKGVAGVDRKAERRERDEHGHRDRPGDRPRDRPVA